MPEFRVLQMIGDLNIGGSQAFVMNIYRHLPLDKVQFDFIIDHPFEQFYSEEIIQKGGKVYYIPAFNGKNLFQVVAQWKAFFIEHPEYKIIHSHVRSYASIYLPIAKANGVKTIIHSHSTSNGKRLFQRIIKSLLQYPLRFQADYFVACSKQAGQWLFGKRIVSSTKFRLLYNAIDLEEFKPSNEIREKIRNQLDLGNNLIFGHVGRFVDAKNHSFLIQVFYKIHKTNPHTKLLLIGDGYLKPMIEGMVRKYSISDSVLFLGNRSDVGQIMQAMDVFLFPSLWEGLSVVTIEAQAAGLPCIISDTIPTVTIVQKLIHKVSISSVDEWVETSLQPMQKLTSEPIEMIRSGYNIEIGVKQILSFYSRIITDK